MCMGRPEEGGNEQKHHRDKASGQSLARLPTGATPPPLGWPLAFC